MKKISFLLITALLFLCACGTQIAEETASKEITANNIKTVEYDSNLIPLLEEKVFLPEENDGEFSFSVSKVTNELYSTMKEVYQNPINEIDYLMTNDAYLNTEDEDYFILCLAEDEELANKRLIDYFGEKAKNFKYYEDENETIKEYAERYYQYIEHVFTDKNYNDGKGSPESKDREKFLQE